MKILIVLTSNGKMGDTGDTTGFWLEEFATPYYIFKDQGIEVTLASPKGGQPPVDPRSEAPGAQTAATERFLSDVESQNDLTHTHRLDSINPADFDAIFYPGGHGPLWDLSEDKYSISLIENFNRAGKPLGLVCHAPGVLRHVKGTDDAPLVKGKRVTGFSNSEEDAVQLTDAVPFLLEDMLKSNQGVYNKGADWTSYIEVDGNLVTGQNPASSKAVADEILKLLNQ